VVKPFSFVTESVTKTVTNPHYYLTLLENKIKTSFLFD